MEIFEDEKWTKEEKRSLVKYIKINFPTEIEFYNTLSTKDKRAYFMHFSRHNNPYSPTKWFLNKKELNYEFSFLEIANIMNISIQEVRKAYESGIKKLSMALKCYGDCSIHS